MESIINNYFITKDNKDNNYDINYDVVYHIISYYIDSLELHELSKTDISKDIYRLIKKNMILKDLYNFIADDCVLKSSHHPDFKKLSSHICIDILNSETDESFRNVVHTLYNNIDKSGNHFPSVSKELCDIVDQHHELIQSKMDFSRDYYYDYFGIKTLERSYLLKLKYITENGKVAKTNRIIERPQHMIMRVALGIHDYNLEAAFETYDYISKRYMTHATPTLFNAGTPRPQMSSCFLLNSSDSIDNIFDSIGDIAKISKWAGGIGIALSDIRAKSSLIRGTGGDSSGIIPLCLLLNVEGTYVNQGGKRNGSIAVYLEPWHADIFEFCELRKNTKNESEKARDLFLALWVPNIFMRRVKENKMWSLMCPDECPGLTTCHGEEFDNLYTKYEDAKLYKKQVRAVDLWFHILGCQFETGMPYMLFKDNANEKSNQKNLGTIKCSNLCTEIIEYSDQNTISVCNLASICLPMFLKNGVFDFNKLGRVTETLVNNLNIIIDKNFYPVEKARKSNMKNRPIGIGVQGLSDLYNILGYPFESIEAETLNRKIFETIYFHSMKKSMELAKVYGPYESFNGSPVSKGILQYHMWNIKEDDLMYRDSWIQLIEDIKRYGVRNSLTTTCMPTASTAQIMKNSESIEPLLSNVYTRTTLAGEFLIVNEYLVRDLMKINLWNPEIRKAIIINDGSVQNINVIPDNIKNVYKTAFEIKLKSVLKQSVQRGAFIDQSQSLNLFIEKPDFKILTSAHFYSWENGLKTGLYYLRTKPSVDPLKFGFDLKEVESLRKKYGMKNNRATQTEEKKDVVVKACPFISKKRRMEGNIADCLICSS